MSSAMRFVSVVSTCFRYIARFLSKSLWEGPDKPDKTREGGDLSGLSGGVEYIFYIKLTC